MKKTTTIKTILFICEVLDLIVLLIKKAFQEIVQFILGFSLIAVVIVGLYVTINWIDENVFDEFNHWYHVERFEINE